MAVSHGLELLLGCVIHCTTSNRMRVFPPGTETLCSSLVVFMAKDDQIEIRSFSDGDVCFLCSGEGVLVSVSEC